MKKFGLGKGKEKGDKPDTTVEESTRNRLFGSRSKSKGASPAPVISNPYAINSGPPAGGNPYANSNTSNGPNPYATDGNGNGGNNGSLNFHAQKSNGGNRYGDVNTASSAGPPPPAYETGGYAGANGSAYRNEKSSAPGQSSHARFNDTGDYSNQRGYGGSQFSETSSIATTRVGGYGGYGNMGSRETLDTDAGKEVLFGGARERLQQRHADGQLPLESDSAMGNGGGQSSGDYGYGGNYDKQLTAEEQEEEDIQATKSQIRDLKREDVSLLQNGIRIAAQAEETGRATLERLGLQGEMIYNAEKNLDLSANQNRLADEKTREINRLNRSMFIPNVGNPFTKTRRQREMDDRVIEQHHRDKNRREATRAAAYESAERQQGAQRRLRDAWEKDNGRGADQTQQQKKMQSLKERSKYQFEADSEDEQLEDEIDQSLDVLHGAAGRLNMLGKAIGQELESQNEHITRIGGKVDKADDELEMLRAKLSRIK